MGPHTSAVREVLQWLTELERNKKARSVELGGETPENTKLVTYVKHATALRQMKGDALDSAVAKVAELDKQNCLERLKKDDTLGKWDKFLLANKQACQDAPAFKEAERLLALAKGSLDADPLKTQEHLATPRKALWPDAPVGMGKSDIPGVPSGQTRRTIDKTEALKALKHKDLDMLIARNDTWGNFDPARALGKDATEEDLKVLLNVIESAVQAEAQETAWKDYETKAALKIKARGHELPEPVKVYKEVILGAGASAAYYIVSNYGQFDMDRTLVLGELQPWAEERGKSGNINHPHNQIDPRQKGSKPIEDSDEGLAERAEFSKRIAEVIAKVPHIRCQIGKVRRCEGDVFEIETDQGLFYASKVSNALGIGKQKRPEKVAEASDPKTKDMDSFKRSLDGGKTLKQVYGDVKTVAVVGGNAAIDVVTTILRNQGKNPSEKMHIHWLAGESGPPAFLNGTDNALAKEAYPPGKLEAEKPITNGNMTVYKGYLASVSGSGPVTVEYTCAKKPQPSFEVDLVIYGTGPDVKAMQDMFVDETTGSREAPKPLALETVVDKSRHYNSQIEVKDPALLIEKLADKLPTTGGVREKLLEYLQDPSLKDVKDNPGDVVVGLKSKDDGGQSSMQFVGASGARLDLGKDTPNPLNKPGHETLGSLPENVVGNDQLAPSRSRIEAQFNALPTSTDDLPLVATQGGVNFITSNQTVIRVHIAECYPKIPPGLGDYITGQIILERSRRPKDDEAVDTPIPSKRVGDTWMENMSLDKQKAFQKRWTERLNDIHTRMA